MKYCSSLALIILLFLNLSCQYPSKYESDENIDKSEITGFDLFLSETRIYEKSRAAGMLYAILANGEKKLINNGEALWRCSEPEIAKVDSAGCITGLSPGTVKIQASINGVVSEKDITVLKLADFSRLMLSEVFYDAVNDDTGKEYIEIHNANDYECDISGFKLVDGAATSKAFVFPEGAQIKANGFITVGQSASSFRDLFGTDPDYFGFSFSLNNTGETVFLKFPDGSINDVVYIAGGTDDFKAPLEWGSASNPKAAAGSSVKRKNFSNTKTYLDWESGVPSPGH